VTRWRWRGNIALLGVALAFVLYPMLPNEDVINSDWPAFATGALMIVDDPGQLYDLHAQSRFQDHVTGGRHLVTLGIGGILPFLAPAWVALLAVPFAALGTDLGGRLWILFGLLCLGAGLYLATRGSPPPHSWGGAGRSPAVGLLPAFASVPTALVMLNAQLDGVVVLGVGGAIALWSRPYLAGLTLGLTLMKPQLVLPLGVALILARRWTVIAGWATAGAALLVPTLILNPHWIFDWLGQTRSTVQAGAREVDLPHLAVLLPGATQGVVLATLTALAVIGVVALARMRRDQFQPAAAILIAGGVLAAPHALPADLVLVALALGVWGEARWWEWLGLSVVALAAALIAPPVPTIIGVIAVGWVCLRASGLLTWGSPEPARASAR
jgi:Glycosyltransferase family 87